MHPRFRTDLSCSREEQQGVVFYRIDDPETRTSFRLYEIEYLIAQKLDGSRAIAEVIQAVKDEYNFDISEADLSKFVNQLESMGFIAGLAATLEQVADEDIEDVEITQTAVDSTEEVVEEAEPQLDIQDAPVDRAEVTRLLKSALSHVKQGHVVHARDYFLAARELDPSNEPLAQLVGHVNAIGNGSGQAEAAYLWQHAKELFAELADQIDVPEAPGPADPLSGTDAFDEVDPTDEEADEQDLGTRVKWTVALLAVLVLGVGGLILAARALGVFESAARVRLHTLAAERTAVFHPEAAVGVRPVEEALLKFESAGTVADELAAVGDRVQAGQVIATLDLPPKVRKLIDKARGAVEKAEAKYEMARERLEEILSKREAIEVERAEAEEKLRELRPKSVLKQDGVSKQDLEEWKKAKLRANKKLSQLAKKERQPRNQEAKLKKKLEAARKKLEASEKRIAQKLIRAPFSGRVLQVKVSAGQRVESGAEAVLVRNPLLVRLAFEVEAAGGLQAGGEAQVAVDQGTPASAKVVSVAAGKAQDGKKTEILVDLSDPAGTFLQMKPEAFHLVREFVERAFLVPADAVCEQKGAEPYVIVALDSRALRRPVEVLQMRADRGVIRDSAGHLREGVQIVSVRLDEEGTIAGIPDGAVLQIEE